MTKTVNTKGVFGAFSTNNDLEVNGKWFDFPANEDKTIPAFSLARMGDTNPAYVAGLERLQKELGRDIELDILDDAAARPHMIKLFVDTVLKGWRNLQGPDGKVIEYSKENATTLMNQLPDLYRILVLEARKMVNYRNAVAVAVSE